MSILAQDDRRRPHDRADLIALLTKATPSDLTTVARLLTLIRQRGCHRGKDLHADLARLRADIAPP